MLGVPSAIFPPALAVAPSVFALSAPPSLFPAASPNAQDNEKWRLQVQALSIAPMELHDLQKSDSVAAHLRRLQHPYLGCLMPDKPFFDDTSEADCGRAFEVLGLSREDSRHFRPFPKLTELERSFLHAEVFGEKSRDSIDKPLQIPFILDIPQEVCRLRYQPPKRKIKDPKTTIASKDFHPIYVQKINLVQDKEKENSFFEIETNYYWFDKEVVGSEKIVCANVCAHTIYSMPNSISHCVDSFLSFHQNHTMQDLVIFSWEQDGVAAAPAQAAVQQSFSADSATFCLDRTYLLSSVQEEADAMERKTVMRIKIPDNPPACDYSLLGSVFDVDAIQTVEPKDEYKGPAGIEPDPKDKTFQSQSNWSIKIHAAEQPLVNDNFFALFFVPPQHANHTVTNDYIFEMTQCHGFQLGWLYEVRPNAPGTPGFQVKPVFRTRGDPSPYSIRAPAFDKENDPLWQYDFGYAQLNNLAKRKPPQGHFKVLLIPRRIVLMPLYFKPDSLFTQRTGNARELQLAPDNECFAIIAGVKPGSVFHSSIISQIQYVRDALIKHFRMTGFSSDFALDPLAVFSFCSNKITDPDICRMLLSCCEDIAAVLGCRKKSKRVPGGLLYTHPDQINTLWKLYGIGLAVESFNRLVHSSKSFSHTLHNISQQEVIDLALKIHFVERVGSIFEIQQRVLLQCFDVMDVDTADTFADNRAENLLNFLACVKREVFEPGVDEKDQEGDVYRKVFRMPQNISRIIRKLLRVSPPFHKATYHQLISEVIFMASTSLSLVSRFIKQFTAASPPRLGLTKRSLLFSSSQHNSNYVKYVEESCCIFQQCDQTAFDIQSCLPRQGSSGGVVNNPHFLQMSITVVVAAMVDFVSPMRYCPINDRPFASDHPNPSYEDHPQLHTAKNFIDRIKILQKVKSRCDRLKHINLRKTVNQSPGDISYRRACYYGIVDLALHTCWYSMCQRGEDRCMYNIPQSQEPQSYLPFETYSPLRREQLDIFDETPKILERWSSGLVFLNKVMLPSLSLCSDPSSKAVRVWSVSSICNFLRTCASLDDTIFKFLFFRDLVSDHRVRGKVSACHLLLESTAACIDLEPGVSLSIHNNAVLVEDEEELDEDETLWFPFKLLHLNYRNNVEFESHFFQTARLSSTFRLMKSLCSLSLLSAASFLQNPEDPSDIQPSSIYNCKKHLEIWLNELNNIQSEKCPVKQSLENDDDEDSQYFNDPYFLTCYMMMCKESVVLDSIPEFLNDPEAKEYYFSNYFIKASAQSHKLHLPPQSHRLSYDKLVYYFRDKQYEVCPSRSFTEQFFDETVFDFDSEDFKYEFTNSIFNHDRMVTNWIDFLSAYVELNSKKLSCPEYDFSETDNREELEDMVSSLQNVLSVEDVQNKTHCHKRIFDHMRRVFGVQSSEDPDMHVRWNSIHSSGDGLRNKRAPRDVNELSKQKDSSVSHFHPLDLNPSDDPQFGGLTCIGIYVSFWMFPFTTISMKSSIVRYLRCYLESVHNFHQHLIKQMSLGAGNFEKVKLLEKIKDLAAKKCRWLFCIPDPHSEPPKEVPPVISAISFDFDKKEWSHTIEILKLLRVMLIFEVDPSKYMYPIIHELRLQFQDKHFEFLSEDSHQVTSQRFEVFTCFASILADLCESFDPADYFLSQQEPTGNSEYCKFRYAILRQVCTSGSCCEPLCRLCLRVLSYVSRHAHYAQLMPAALASSRLLLTAHERQKELGTLRASDKFIFRPFEEVSLDSFEMIMISNLAVPFLFCAAGHMEIRTFPALSLYMSCFHCYSDNVDRTDGQTPQSNSCSHRILLEFPKQLCSWVSSSTLLSLSNSVLLLSSSFLLLSRILDDAARTIPNSSHGILQQIMPSAEIPSSHRCGPALVCVDRTLSYVVETLLEEDGFGFFVFHSFLNGRHGESHLDPSNNSLIHQWIFSSSGNGLSTSSRRLSKFLSCQSLAHHNVLIGDFFCKVSFGEDGHTNVFGTFHPFQLQVFDEQECHDAIFQKLMDVGSEKSHECVKGNFSAGANTLVNFMALLQALACVSVNGVCDILRTCPSKTDSSHHAPSLAHILLNQHAMFSHSIVDDSSFVVFDDYTSSRLLVSLLRQVKSFFSFPMETERFENLNNRMVWLLPILSKSWEIIAFLLDDPFSRLLCTHVIEIFRSSIPGESWLWGTCGDVGLSDAEANPRHTGLFALIDCASFLNYFLKMNSNLNPSHPNEEFIDYKYLQTLHVLLSHSINAISWSVKALKSMTWIVTTLCPDRFSYDFTGLVNVWRWADGKQFWNRVFVGNFPTDEPRGYPEEDDDHFMSDHQPEISLLQKSIKHAVESRFNFGVEQQLFELTLRCRNNEFDNVGSDVGHMLPDWFDVRLRDWYFFEDKINLGNVLSEGLNSAVDLPQEWDSLQSKARKLNVSLVTPQSSSFRWMKSSYDPFKIVDRNMLEVVFRRSNQSSGTLPLNQDETFKSISLHALHFNHALSLKSSKCHLAQSLGSLFSVIFRAHSSEFDMGATFQREELATCVIFIDFSLRMCLFLRDWLVSHLQSDFTLRFLKAARAAVSRLKGFSDIAKESFLQGHRAIFLKISENLCQVIISKSSYMNQAATLERQELYALLLEYLSAFNCNDSGYQDNDFVLQSVLCCDEQRYLPLAFYTILRDVSNADTFQSIEAMMLLARLLRLVPATISIVNVVASSASFGSPLIKFVEGPLSQMPLFSSLFYARCLLLCRVVQRNSSLIAPVIVAVRQSPFFVNKGAFFSVVSTPSSQQNAPESVAQFADQVIAFHLVADSFMSVIFRCAFALDTLQSFSASEGLLELLHFLHFGFYQYRSGDNLQVEHWLLRLLRHFSGSTDPYLEYLARRRACLPAPYMRPFSSLVTCLYSQVSAALLSLAVLQRHRVRNWSGAIPSLAVFNIADKEVPQVLVHTALLDASVASVDILELPRGRLSQDDFEYDHMMAIYQMRLDVVLYASTYCRHTPAEYHTVGGRPFFQYAANFDPGLMMALKNLQISSPLLGANVPHVRHLFEICYKMTSSIKSSHDSDYPSNQLGAEWQPRADVGLRNKLRSVMLAIVQNLCHCVVQLLLAHLHLRLDPLVFDPESGYITIALDIIHRATICARDGEPSACDSLHALHLELLRIKFLE